MFILSNSSLITRITQNSKQSLNLSIKDLLRMSSKDVHRSLRQSEISIIKTAYKKHTICNDYFYRTDYPSISSSYFYYLISTLKPIFTRCSNFKPSPYKLNRVYFDETLRIKDTGLPTFTLDQQLHNYLLMCKQQPPQFHDIALEVTTDLHDKLLLTKLKPNFHNGGYVIPVPIDARYSITATVYKRKMFVNVGCTNNTLPFSPAGFGELDFLMGGMIVYLTTEYKSEFFVQPIGEWIQTNYHLNYDLEIDIPECRHTINYLREHATIYIHEQDKKKFLRYEKKITTPKTINEIQEEFK